MLILSAAGHVLWFFEPDGTSQLPWCQESQVPLGTTG